VSLFSVESRSSESIRLRRILAKKKVISTMVESAVAPGSSAPFQGDDDSVKNSRWRSTGWMPLVYPASALFTDETGPEKTTNPSFPLHPDVLRAAVRELLILDRTVDARTIALSLMTARFRDRCATDMASDHAVGPQYLRHVDPSRWDLLTEEKKAKAGKKRITVASVLSRKKKRGEDDNRHFKSNEHASRADAASWPLQNQHVAMEDSCYYIREKVQNAEALTEIIVKRSFLLSNMSANPSFLETEKISPENEFRSPRKVSDADTDESTSLNPHVADRVDESYGGKDISRFFDICNRNTGDSLTVLREDIPSLVEVSIFSEATLRNLAFSITRKLTESFDDKTLRIFLGYKSSALKRDRLLYVLSEYFFDVSHATFAWKQTEKELQAEEKASATEDGLEHLEKIILRTLFDNRALRKIGGFDASSLLPHALSISRLRVEGVTWEQFAKTACGKILLQHHREGKSLTVGQRRRGQRVRSRLGSIDSSEGGSRSRSSSISIASSDGMEIVRDERGKGASDMTATVQVEAWNEQRQLSFQMPDVLHICLRKTPDKSWGILLSKEGELCVVVRAPETTNDSACLKIGDVILSITDNTQETAAAAASGERANGKEKRDWFRRVVNLFKESDELDLIVRRVGSARTLFQDDSCLGGEAPNVKVDTTNA
jgi:hypothetical protein